MNDIEIFVFGQLSTFKAVLQALSAMFDPTNSEFFVSGDGIGAGAGALLATLLATMGLFSTYFQQAKVNVGGPLLGMILYVLVCVPKVENVWLTDMYTGRTELVQNIPVGIATMGFAMSTISKNLVDIFELEFSQPGIVGGQDYTSSLTNGDGFLSPLKMMMALRENALKPAPSHLIFNTASYIKYCLNKKKLEHPNSPPHYNKIELQTANDPMDYFLDQTLIVDNYAETMNPTTGVQGVKGCLQLNTMLASDAPGGLRYYLLNPATFGAFAYGAVMMSDEAAISKCKGALDGGGNCATRSDALSSSDRLISAVLGSQNVNNRYMEVRLLEDISVLMGTVGEMESQTIENIASTMTYNIELSRMQETIEGETFLHYMMTAMNAMTYLFYGLFPLAMLIMVARGAAGFTYLGGYMLFGLWVYSWIPVATVINFSTISSVMDAFKIMEGQIPLTIETNHYYIQNAMDAIAVGSNLMAAVPIITLSIVSGSMFALSSVAASSANPSGAAGKVASQNTPAYSNSPSLVNGKSSYYASDSSGAGAGAGSALVTSMLSGRSTMANTTHSNALTAAEALVTSQSKELGGAITRMYGHGQNVSQGVTASNGTSLNQTALQQTGAAYRSVLEKSGVDTEGMNDQQMISVGGAIIGGTPGKMAGIGLHAQETTASQASKVDQEKFSNAISSELVSSGAIQHIESAVNAETSSNTGSKQASETVSAIESYKHADSLRSTKQTEAKKAQQITQTQSIDGIESFSAIGRETNGEALKSYGNMKAYLSDSLSDSIQQANLGADSEKLQEQLSTGTDAFRAGKFNEEVNAMTAYESALNTMSNLAQNARNNGNFQEAAMWTDLMSDLSLGLQRDGYMGDQLTKSRDALSSIPTDVSGATVSTDVATSNQEVRDQIASDTQSLKAPDEFKSGELNQAREFGKDLDAISSHWNNGNESGTHFSEGYFSDDKLTEAAVASNYLSQEDVAAGKGFDDIGDTQKRDVLASQAIAASQDYAQGFDEHLKESTAFNSAERSTYTGQVDAMVNSLDSFVDKSLNNDATEHSQGTIGQGELKNVLSASRGVANQSESIAHKAEADSVSKGKAGDSQRQNTLDRAAVRNEGWTGNFFGANSGIDPELFGRASAIASESQAMVDSGVFKSQEEGNQYAKNQMDDLMELNGEENWFDDDKATAFQQNFNSLLDEQHTPETALGLALDGAGYNQTGSLQNGAMSIATFGVLGGGAGATLHEAGATPSTEGSSGLKEKAAKFSKIAGGSGVGALLSLGAASYQYEEHEAALENKSKNQSANILTNEILDSINQAPPGKRAEIAEQFIDNLIDKSYDGDRKASDFMKGFLKDQSEGQGYSATQMTDMMDLMTTPFVSQDNKPLMSSKEMIDIFNSNRGEAPRI